ncbi:MAG: hypothetical protein ACM336_10795 [Acidobacteriota bacterium]|jgi:hypothetical protein|nr:hypothetical protein [Bryobacteraceae bacterium]
MARWTHQELVRKMKIRSMPPQAGRTEWEYMVVTGDAESPELLAECGALGWELVAVVREFGARATFYFKRRKN